MLRLFSLPRINDITTDLTDPPSFSDAGDRRCSGVSYPESFKPKVRAGYPDLASLHLTESPDVVYSRAVDIARSMDRWEIVSEDAENHTLEAVATTATVRFKDDIAIRIRATDSGSRVDIRSRSRLGKHDFGANADRIRAFLSQLSG